MQSVTTLTFKSPWFHLEHMAHREDERSESKTGEGRGNEHRRHFLIKWNKEEGTKKREQRKLTLSLSGMYKDDTIITTKWS
jgi:hypothetical protein